MDNQEIIEKIGLPLSYKVEINHRHHVDEMLPSKSQVVISDKNTEEDIFIPTPVNNNPAVSEPATEHEPAPVHVTHLLEIEDSQII